MNSRVSLDAESRWNVCARGACAFFGSSGSALLVSVLPWVSTTARYCSLARQAGGYRTSPANGSDQVAAQEIQLFESNLTQQLRANGRFSH